MKTKSILVLAIAFLFNGNAAFANDRIPFCKSMTVVPEANEVIITVPENERLVLLKLYADCYDNQDWHLDIDNQVLLAGTISNYNVYVHDFPDSCVVVPTGKTFTAVNKSPWWTLKLTLIGYFEKIDTGLVSDLNGDGRIDFADFAILANEWLSIPS